MRKNELRKAKTLIEKVDKNIRNKDISSYIISKIGFYLEKGNSIIVDECSFKGLNRKTKDYFNVRIEPNFKDITNIYIEESDFEGKSIIKETIEFKDGLVLIKKTEDNNIIDSQTKKTVSLEKKKLKIAYLDNNLIYEKKSIHEMFLNIEDMRDSFVEEVTYITKERESVIRTTSIREDNFIENGCSYSSTKFYDTEKFNSKDSKNHYHVNYFSKSTKEEFDRIKDETLKLIENHKVYQKEMK